MKNMNSSKGFSLIEMLVVVGVSSVVSFGMLQMVTNMNVEIKKAQVKATANLLRSEIKSLVISDSLWDISRNNPGNDGTAAIASTQSFYCFDSMAGCTNGAPRHFILYRDSNITSNLTSNNPDPTRRGINFFGQPCTISDLSGDDSCPFQLTLTYTPVCGTAICDSATSNIEINAEFTYKPSSNGLKMPFNSANYSVTFTRPSSDVVVDNVKTQADIFDNFNGVHYRSGKISINRLYNSGGSALCGSGQYLKGFNVDGSKNCQNLPSAATPITRYICISRCNNGLQRWDHSSLNIIKSDFDITNNNAYVSCYYTANYGVAPIWSKWVCVPIKEFP